MPNGKLYRPGIPRRLNPGYIYGGASGWDATKGTRQHDTSNDHENTNHDTWIPDVVCPQHVKLYTPAQVMQFQPPNMNLTLIAPCHPAQRSSQAMYGVGSTSKLPHRLAHTLGNQSFGSLCSQAPGSVMQTARRQDAPDAPCGTQAAPTVLPPGSFLAPQTYADATSKPTHQLGGGLLYSPFGPGDGSTAPHTRRTKTPSSGSVCVREPYGPDRTKGFARRRGLAALATTHTAFTRLGNTQQTAQAVHPKHAVCTSLPPGIHSQYSAHRHATVGESVAGGLIGTAYVGRMAL